MRDTIENEQGIAILLQGNEQPSSREKPLFTVYVLRSLVNGKLYIGYSSDVGKRIEVHERGKGRWTRGKGPWGLIYQEEFAEKSKALSREKYLKSGWGRAWLRRLIEKAD